MSIAVDAKEIAFHFFDATQTRATKSIIARTIVQAKSILNDGYTKEEIISVIDYLIKVKKVELYSIGYISSAINNVLREVKKQQDSETRILIAEQTQQEISATIENQRNEVKINDESSQRNQDKLNRFGVQPRFGKEFDFDMFKK